MDSDAISGKHGRRFAVGQPAAVRDARLFQGFQSMGRVTDAVDPGLQTQRLYRAKQKFVQFRRTLLIAPVADPDEIPFREGKGGTGCIGCAEA